MDQVPTRLHSFLTGSGKDGQMKACAAKCRLLPVRMVCGLMVFFNLFKRLEEVTNENFSRCMAMI